MKLLKDYLFGKLKFYKSNNLGVFEARIKDGKLYSDKSWHSWHNEMNIILEGDSSGPYDKQINEVSQLISKIQQLKGEISLKILKDEKLKIRYKNINSNCLKLVSISPWEENKNSYELNFECLDSNKKEIGVICKEYKIEEVL